MICSDPAHLLGAAVEAGMHDQRRSSVHPATNARSLSGLTSSRMVLGFAQIGRINEAKVQFFLGVFLFVVVVGLSFRTLSGASIAICNAMPAPKECPATCADAMPR